MGVRVMGSGGSADSLAEVYGNAQLVNDVGGAIGDFAGQGQTVAIGAASAQSTAITARAIAVSATVACFIAIGSNPTAAANTGFYLHAGSTVSFPITSGHKVAVIQAASAGSLYIHPIA